MWGGMWGGQTVWQGAWGNNWSPSLAARGQRESTAGTAGLEQRGARHAGPSSHDGCQDLWGGAGGRIHVRSAAQPGRHVREDASLACSWCPLAQPQATLRKAAVGCPPWTAAWGHGPIARGSSSKFLDKGVIRSVGRAEEGIQDPPGPSIVVWKKVTMPSSEHTSVNIYHLVSEADSPVSLGNLCSPGSRP